MSEYKHNKERIKSVRTKIPKSGLNTGEGNIFAHQKRWFQFSFGSIFRQFGNLWNPNLLKLPFQGEKIAFTTTLMLILLFCVIRGRLLMPENAVNPLIYGPLWTTKTASNDFKTKMAENKMSI